MQHKQTLARPERFDLNQAEIEVVALDIICDAIGAIVNHETLVFYGENTDVEMQFTSRATAQLCSALISDLLEPMDGLLVGSKASVPAVLKRVCAAPAFEDRGSAGAFRTAAEALHAWLGESIHVPVYLHALPPDSQLSLTREELLSICGTISKHNRSRLTRIAGRVSAILERSDLQLNKFAVLQVLDDLYDRFFNDVFSHMTMPLMEHLNDVRWGIQDYLQPQFMRSLIETPGQLEYSYRIPPAIQNPMAQSCYRNLLNAVRAKPYVKRFSVRRPKTVRY